MSGTPVAVGFNTSQESTKTSAGRTTATGSTFFVVISEQLDQAGVQAPTDSKGNTFLQLGTTQPASVAGSQLRVYACENGVGGANHQVTVAWNNGAPVLSDASMWFIECPGVAAASIDIGSLGQGFDGSPPYSVAAGTVDAAVDQFLSFISGAWNGPYDPSTTAQPFTLLDEETNSGLYWTGGVAYRNGTGATTATWTCPSSSQCALMIVGLKPAAAVAGIAGAGQIASGEAVGTPTVGAAVAASAVGSAQAVGAPLVGARISAAGVASAEVVGSPTIRASIAAAAIASAEAAGAPAVGGGIRVAGMPSAEALGAPALAGGINAAGVASGEVFGAPVVGGEGVFVAGIASAEAAGQPSIAAGLQAAGIPSSQAVPAPAIAARVAVQGMPSAEAFGAPVVGGPFAIVCLGIPSAESFGASQIGGLEWTREIYLVPPENRIFRMRAEDRIHRVPPENRTLKVTA